MVPDNDIIRAVAEAIEGFRLVVVASGAGTSKESGVPTFRDALEGLWADFDPEELATPQAFQRNPDLVWSWYMERYRKVQSVKPNPGHYAIASLEELYPQVTVLTQNVDGLHAVAGSTDVVELHGSIRRFKCFAACRGEPTRVDIAQLEVTEEKAPLCPYCATAKVRPDVVWFGELLPVAALERARALSEKCDVFVVVGTSGVVEPAASLPRIARAHGITVIEINPEETLVSRYADFCLRGPSGEMLPRLIQALRALRQGDHAERAI